MAITKDTTIKELGGHVTGRVLTVGRDRTTLIRYKDGDVFYSQLLDEYSLR